MPVRPVREPRVPEFNASLVERADLTASIARFVVRPDNGVPAFEPGQYLRMIAAASRVLAERGFAPDALISEHYWTDPVPTTVNRD